MRYNYYPVPFPLRTGSRLSLLKHCTQVSNLLNAASDNRMPEATVPEFFTTPTELQYHKIKIILQPYHPPTLDIHVCMSFQAITAIGQGSAPFPPFASVKLLCVSY